MFKNKTMLLFWIFIIAVILISCPANLGNKIEGFYIDGSPYKKYCSHCGYKSKRSCAKCVNCGICVTPNGYSECLPGDSSGPYFRNDCIYWNYGRSYYPYNHIEPVIKRYSRRPLRKYKRRKFKAWKWWEYLKPNRWTAYDKFMKDENMFRYGWKGN